MNLFHRAIPGRTAASPRDTRKATFVFIIGMHRSGTSCLAGSLERCRLFLREVTRCNRYNPKDNHELKAVRRIRNEMLAANGGTWRQPPVRVMVNWHLNTLA